jgi:microcystin degradation protein MlrC
MAVKLAMAVGEGNDLMLRLGGKMGLQSGNPVDLTVTIKKIVCNMAVDFAGTPITFGNAIALSIHGLKNADIVIHDARCQTYSTECFTKLGVDPLMKNILIVKSSAQFRESFSKISDDIHIVSTKGALTPNFTAIKYKNLKKKFFR